MKADSPLLEKWCNAIFLIHFFLKFTICSCSKNETKLYNNNDNNNNNNNNSLYSTTASERYN